MQLGPRLVPHGHKVSESTARTKHEIPILPDTFLVIFQVCAARKASFRISSPPWFCTAGDLGSPPSWSSCLAPRSLVPLLGHGVALQTTARVLVIHGEDRGLQSASLPNSPKTPCAAPDVHNINCSASTVKLRFGLRLSSVQHKGGAPGGAREFRQTFFRRSGVQVGPPSRSPSLHVGQRGGCFKTVIDNEAQ